MPSRIFQQNEDNNSDLEPSDNKASFGVAPFEIPDDSEEYINGFPKGAFVNDGVVVSDLVQVLRSGAKISTEFDKSEIPISKYDRPKEVIGKKLFRESSKVKSLKSKFSISWTKMGQKLVYAVAVLTLVFVVMFSIGATYIIRLWNNVPSLDSRPFESSVVYARDGKTVLFRYYQEERREILPLCTAEEEVSEDPTVNCIPRSMQLAMIALEDERFYYNPDGIPWSNIAGAVIKCAQSAGDECRGGSGLSQQLVKNVTKQDDVTIERKITELLTAIKLNQQISKSDILFLYLNEVPFGRNAYGVQEAARSYFGKNIKNITLPEACFIASLVQKPSVFNNSINNPLSSEWFEFEGRKNVCLTKMHELDLQGDGFERVIKTEAELEMLKREQVVFQPNKDEFPFPHFRDFVTDELRKFRISEQALSTQGYKIVTTLDPDIQANTERIVKEMEQESVLANGANNVAAVVLDGPSGEILSMVGSRDYNNVEIDGQVNIVTSPQQPGSSVKPYVYAAALSKNFNPGTILFDLPTTFEGNFRPKNYSGTFSGPVSFRFALQGSLNIPAVKAAYLAAGEGVEPNGLGGINEVFNFSEQVGLRYPCIDGAFNNNPIFANNVETCQITDTITSDVVKNAYKDRCYVSSSIGGCEVTMLSHATGMNTFAQDGNLRTATPFLSIVNTQTGIDVYKAVQESDNPVYPKRDAVIDPLLARQMNNILSDYQSRIPIFGQTLARNLELEGWDGDFRVAAKTGTTDLVKDTWTVGYTPYYTTAVWVGNTDNKPMNDNATSASAPAPIWKEIMTYLHQNKEKKGFSREGLVPVRLDPRTGLLVDQGGIVELLLPSQIEALKQAATLLSKPDYNPRANSIIQNRSPIISRKLKVNLADNKLAVEGKTLPKNISEVTCGEVLSEFPSNPGWSQSVDSWAGRTGQGDNCPNQPSDQDQVSDQNSLPLVTTNITGNRFDSIISITAQTQGNSQKNIAKINLLIDGAEVASVVNQNTLSYPIPPELYGNNRVITIIAEDSWGIASQTQIGDIVLGLAPIEISDIPSLTPQCAPVAANSLTTCSISIPSGKSAPSSITLGVGTANTGGTCASTGRVIVCASIPTGSTSGSQPIFISIGGSPATQSGGKSQVN